MNTQLSRINAVAAITVLLLTVGGTAYPQQSMAQGTRDESADQFVQLGDSADFAVDAVDGRSYQWMHNGTAVSGQTNSTLTIENTQISDAGFYSCNVANGADVASSISASLEIYTVTPDIDVVVYAFPTTSSGSLPPCPGAYAGYVNYTKTVAQGWGWAPNTNTTIYTASDMTRTNTKVEYVGAYGDEGCAKTNVTIHYPPYSPVYRFSIYFPSKVPTTNYPITLTGFNP